MKQVKVYVISEQIKALTGPSLEIYRIDRDARHVGYGDQFLGFPTPRRTSLPVHKYRDASGVDTYVAIDPDIAEESLRAARERLSRFAALPWPLRVWRAFRREG